MFDEQEIKRAASEEVLRQMPTAVILAEAPSGRIIFRNRRALQIAEQSPSRSRPAKLEDADDFEIFHSDGRPYEMEEWPLLRSIRTGEEVRGEEFVYPLADGPGLLVRCDSSPIYDEEGRIVAGVLVGYDITERRRVEEQIRFQARLLDTVAQAVVAIDLQGKITYWNRFAETLYGWSSEEVVGRSAREILECVSKLPLEVVEAGEQIDRMGEANPYCRLSLRIICHSIGF